MNKEIKTFVTGQQLGLLGGPLYTTYKVLGAMHHAEKSGGRAVYWLETNDADFQEINRIRYIDSEKKLRTLSWDINSKGFSCGRIPVDETLVSILEEFFDTLIQTEYTPELRNMALDCYQPGKTLGEASRCLAGRIFEGLDIELFDPSEEDFTAFSLDILLREAENTPDGAQCNLFYMDGSRRLALFRKGGGFVNRRGDDVDLSGFTLVPSLKTRSICQDAWFGTQGYIAGPGEVKYLADLAENFRFHGVKPAEVIPRMSIDLVEPSVKRNLGKLGLEISDIHKIPATEMVKRKVEEVSGFNREELTAQTESLVAAMVNGLNRLGLEGNKLKKKIEKEIREQIGLKRKAVKEKSGSVLRQTETVYLNLRPGGARQERVFNIFYYMNLYGGRGFIQYLYSNYDQKLKFLELNNG